MKLVLVLVLIEEEKDEQVVLLEISIVAAQ
jgi:hypothetical protein